MSEDTATVIVLPVIRIERRAEEAAVRYWQRKLRPKGLRRKKK